ncbi:MAG: ABC transporter permease [Syntrophales bacterium]|nr:ABC transporter permease [Syntrophales bacterium]
MKVLATIWKEFLLLIRDPGGLALIFIMPVALVIVMALIQNNTFREFQETRIDVLFVDEDRNALSGNIEGSFQASPNIHLIKKESGKPLTSEAARQLVQRGDYQAAIIIPAQATVTLREKTKQAVDELFAYYGFGPATLANDSPAVELQLLFDPAIKANYKQALTSAVEKMVTGVQAEWLTDTIQEQFGGTEPKKKIKIDFSRMIHVNQMIAAENTQSGLAINAVQHNVPAWSMFAMFFILFPLAGNFIKEREEGSMLRLRLISGSQFPVISGKFIFYLFVCLLQLVSMIGVGLYVMPVIGLSKLVLGTNGLGVVLTGLAVAMAATGYGLLIAVYFRTPQQALSFGSISVVILAALGGVWVPTFAMPQIMQSISPYSPLNWGLEAFNDLFLRNASTSVILPDLVKLVCFSLVTLAASVLIYKSRTVS